MAARPSSLSIAEGLTASGMSLEHLWWMYLSIGGDAGRLEVEAYILGVLRTDKLQHDLIAQAINEHFIAHGGDHPVAYFEDDTG